MGVINRSLDTSERRRQINTVINNTSTGVGYPVFEAPHPCTIKTARCAAVGLSGAPTSALYLHRFIVGTGMATYAIGGALTHVAIGTSGPQTYSLPATGNSLLNLQTGDVVVTLTAGSNAALAAKAVQLVVEATQEIKSWWGA